MYHECRARFVQSKRRSDIDEYLPPQTLMESIMAYIGESRAKGGQFRDVFQSSAAWDKSATWRTFPR